MANQYSLELVGMFGDPIGIPVAASTTILKGAAVCHLAAGHAINCTTGLTAPVFLGFAAEGCVNSGAAAAESVKVIPWGVKRIAAITGLTGIGDSGTVVYASSASALTNSAGSTNAKVGRVLTFIDGEFYVWFCAGAIWTAS